MMRPSIAITPDKLPRLLESLAADCALEWTTKADIANALRHIVADLAPPTPRPARQGPAMTPELSAAQLATVLHNFDMANTKRGSHHAEGLARFQDIAEQVIAPMLADVLAIGEAEIEKLRGLLRECVPFVPGLSIETRILAAIGQAAGGGE